MPPIVPRYTRGKSRVHRVNTHCAAEPSNEFMSLESNVRTSAVSLTYSMVSDVPSSTPLVSTVRSRYTRTGDRYCVRSAPPLARTTARATRRSAPSSRSRSVPALQPVRNVAVFKSFSVGVQLGVSIVIANRRSKVQRPLSARQHGGAPNPDREPDDRRRTQPRTSRIETPIDGGTR